MICALSFFTISVFGQFSVTISAPENLLAKEVYFYTQDGSKDILISKETKKKNSWSFKYPKKYVGMMKAFFPEINYTMNFVSENKDISIKLNHKNGKISDIDYLDESNKLMNEIQDLQRKKEYILPALYQIKEFYKPDSEFNKAMDKEILLLSNGKNFDIIKHPFISYYNTNYTKFLSQNNNSRPSQQEIINFISNSNEMLETSTLLRPLLLAYFENSGGNVETAADNLLKAVNVETPRGQTVMSEVIELFDVSMPQLKEKYLAQAKNLKCSINDRLSSTITINDKTNIGATFENHTFTMPSNTNAKTIYDVKADKKVIVFWSSTCSHCEKELPQFIPYYNQMKSKNIEIIGLSLDADKNAYNSKALAYPWINDTELRGWYSSFNEKYNIHATPTFFVLDKANKIIAKPEHVNDVLKYLGLN